MQHRILTSLALATLSLGALNTAYAQTSTTYTDNAANAAYASGYASQNGGTGFGAFTVTAVNNAPPYSGTFIGSAAGSEGGTGTPSPLTIDTSGKSFGFYANQGATASVTIARGFQNALGNIGDSFSLDFVPGYNDAGVAGVALTNAGGNVGTFEYESGAAAPTAGYYFSGAYTGQGFTSGALHLVYTRTSATNLRLAVTGAFTQTDNVAISSLETGFTVFQTDTNNTSGNADHNGYFNNLSETVTAPEPGDLTLLGLGATMIAGWAVASRRRRSK